MSEQNVALVRGIYDAFAAGDVPGVLGAMSPDIVWNEAENFIYADGNPYRGPEAILNGVFARCIGEWDGFSAIPGGISRRGRHGGRARPLSRHQQGDRRALRRPARPCLAGRERQGRRASSNIPTRSPRPAPPAPPEPRPAGSERDATRRRNFLA